MKKIKVLLSFCFVLYTCTIACGQAKEKNDLSEEGLIGNVKSFTATIYQVEDSLGEIKEKHLLENYIIYYNTKGNITEIESYISAWHTLSLNGDREFRCVYNYDKNENLVEEKFFNSDGSLNGFTTYKYDHIGNRIEEIYYDKSNHVSEKTTFKYVKKGNEVEETRYDSDGGLDFRCVSKYDEKGNGIEHNGYNSDGSLSFKRQCRYDDIGNMIEEVVYEDEEVLVVDKFGKAEVTSLNYHYFYKYDNKGNIIECYGSNPKNPIKYKYEFDSIGNWIKKIEFSVKGPLKITEREIEYY